MDISGRAAARPVLGSSNPGRVGTAPGGVAHNLASNLALLGAHCNLLAALGEDAFGERIVDELRDYGVGVDSIRRDLGSTGSFLAALDESGELIVGIAEMDATERLSPAHIAAWQPMIASGDLLVADTNLSASTLESLVDHAADAGVDLVLECASTPKAERLALLAERPPNRRPAWIVCNEAERRALLEATPMASHRSCRVPGASLTLPALAGRICVTDGAHGSVVADPGAESGRRYAAYPSEAVDTTGGGDAFTAGLCSGLAAGLAEAQAIDRASAAAAIVVQHSQAVTAALNPAAVEALQRASRARRRQ
jgi:pseudouridine kinase